MRSPLPDERTAAADAVFATCLKRDAERIGAAVATLVPERRALLTVVDRLGVAASRMRGRLLPVARAVLAALATDRLTASLQVRLAARALPWDEVGTLLRRLAAQGDLHSDALCTACAALAAAARRRDAAGLAALTGLAQPPRGWNTQRLARLHAYREDTSALVAAAAQFTLPAEHLETSQASMTH